ncbi:MAG: hypothetical protein FWE31_00350 [Firmicutes bacterium]|nr:hypothetical protein [Bacillota bacterium]
MDRAVIDVVRNRYSQLMAEGGNDLELQDLAQALQVGTIAEARRAALKYDLDPAYTKSETDKVKKTTLFNSMISRKVLANEIWSGGNRPLNWEKYSLEQQGKLADMHQRDFTNTQDGHYFIDYWLGIMDIEDKILNSEDLFSDQFELPVAVGDSENVFKEFFPNHSSDYNNENWKRYAGRMMDHPVQSLATAREVFDGAIETDNSHQEGQDYSNQMDVVEFPSSQSDWDKYGTVPRISNDISTDRMLDEQSRNQRIADHKEAIFLIDNSQTGKWVDLTDAAWADMGVDWEKDM